MKQQTKRSGKGKKVKAGTLTTLRGMISLLQLMKRRQSIMRVSRQYEKSLSAPYICRTCAVPAIPGIHRNSMVTVYVEHLGTGNVFQPAAIISGIIDSYYLTSLVRQLADWGQNLKNGTTKRITQDHRDRR